MAGDTQPFGYGYEVPTDAASDGNVMDFLIRQKLAEVDVMKLVKVVNVTPGQGNPPAAGTVDVLPLVNQSDGNGYSVKHGTVYGIPWFRLQGGTNAIICDPVKGDLGYVTIADRDTTNVRSTKDQATPGSYRKFNIADGIYVGGCLNVAPDQYLIFTDTGCRLVDKNGNSIVMSSTGMVLADSNGNQIQMKAGAVNIVTPVLQVNGVPVTVP